MSSPLLGELAYCKQLEVTADTGYSPLGGAAM